MPAKADAYRRDAHECLEAASAVLGKTASVRLVKQSTNRCTSIVGIEPDLARDPGKDVGIHVRRLAYACPIAGKQQPLFRIRTQQGSSDNRRFCLHDGRQARRSCRSHNQHSLRHYLCQLLRALHFLDKENERRLWRRIIRPNDHENADPARSPTWGRGLGNAHHHWRQGRTKRSARRNIWTRRRFPGDASKSESSRRLIARGH